MSRRTKRIFKSIVIAVVAYALLVVGGCMNVSTPVDVVLNLGSFARDDSLVAPARPRQLVVLQHGMWRSAWALWKLESALEDHGYEVLNFSYASTHATLQEHARALGTRLTAQLRGRAGETAVSFVGHSMGGLVIRRYLSQPDAVRPRAVVFLGTPQRGAVMAEHHHESWLTSWVLGSRAGKQLVPGDPFYAELGAVDYPAGTVIGRKAGGGSAVIPGDDDGRVSLVEAGLPGAEDSIVLSVGHTGLCTDDAVLRQVLHFLRHRRFAR